MPEGHSVHRIADEQQELVGQELRVTSPQGRFSTEAALVDGQRLTSVEAKGKHLFSGFGSVGHLHVHLGMRGKYLRSEAGRPALPQARVRLESLSRRVAWELVAPSTCELIDSDDRASLLARLGPDPLRDDADAAEALRRLALDQRSIGTVLLDQAVVSGVGNVFRAEVLFACGVHPRRPGAALADAELQCLWETLGSLMTRAVREGRILSVPEEPGVNRSLLPEAEGRFVYKQERCRRCGTPVDVETIAGRTSYACPRCQPLLQGEPQP